MSARAGTEAIQVRGLAILLHLYATLPDAAAVALDLLQDIAGDATTDVDDDRAELLLGLDRVVRRQPEAAEVVAALVRQAGTAPLATYASTVPTVATRLERIGRRLALVRVATTRPLTPDEVDDGIHEADLCAAVGEAVRDISDELYWLRCLSGRDLRRPAPDDDDYEAVHGHSRPLRSGSGGTDED